MKEQNEEYRHATAVAEIESSELIALREEVERLKAEKQDMTYAHWDTVADYEQEKQITEHYFKEQLNEQLNEQRNEINELRELVSILSKAAGIDIDKPLTKEEKKALKDAPDW